jgi:hypothetical protein
MCAKRPQSSPFPASIFQAKKSETTSLGLLAAFARYSNEYDVNVALEHFTLLSCVTTLLDVQSKGMSGLCRIRRRRWTRNRTPANTSRRTCTTLLQSASRRIHLSDPPPGTSWTTDSFATYPRTASTCESPCSKTSLTSSRACATCARAWRACRLTPHSSPKIGAMKSTSRVYLRGTLTSRTLSARCFPPRQSPTGRY